jgi:hypothetical protein
MISLKTIAGMGGRILEWEYSIMLCLKYYKNFSKCHKIPPHSTTVKSFKRSIQVQRLIDISWKLNEITNPLC